MAAARHVRASAGLVGDRDLVLQHGLAVVAAHDDQTCADSSGYRLSLDPSSPGHVERK